MHVAFLIIAHVPYVRRAGRQPTGEDMLHELTAGALIPLLGLLSDLQGTGLGPRVAMACSPLLIEQLADPVAQKHFVIWMEGQIARREAELRGFEDEGNRHSSYLARFYLEWSRQALRSFEERFDRNLVKRLRDLVTAHVVEPLASPASYAYLPLLGSEGSVRAQIDHGVLHTTRHLGRPEGFWLPGCGWRPGLERAIADAGMRYIVADSSSLPSGRQARPVWIVQRQLAALFGDENMARHIWSTELGYPGDPLYRNSASPGGYLANGGAEPQSYDPYHALRRAQEHANHFVQLLVSESARRADTDLALVILDARLLGVAWVEGPTWFQAVLTLCATHKALKLTTPADYLHTQRLHEQVSLRPGSWADGGHGPWDGQGAHEYWRALHLAEGRMLQLAERFRNANEDRERALTQAARELLLAQTSDWSEILSSNDEDSELRGRWGTYLARFVQLCELAERDQINAAERFLLDQLEELDGPFPTLNYRIFAP